MHHLNVRVAWHDNRWDGTVCRAPLENTYCAELQRIREEWDEESCDPGCHFADLKPDQLPPCKAEAAAFMNSREWVRLFKHPYQGIKKCSETHGHLLPTNVVVPEYSTFAVPFWWMLRSNQDEIEQTLPEPLPPDEEPPFHSSWVFSRERQEVLYNLFFSRLTPKTSLVFFYTKSGQPIAEGISRLVVGVGTINSIGPTQWYETGGGPSYPMWDRLIGHSIRPDGHEGVLIPYHDYLEPTGDPDEDERRRELLVEVAVLPEPIDIMSFSYAGELSTPDVALSTLVATLESVRRVREHGIAEGPWEQREEWLNEQIATAWLDRGPFPGAGAILEALGMRLGTALSLELTANGTVGPNEDPWPVLGAILRGKKKPPQKAYKGDVEAVATTWTNLSAERKQLALLLSRFNLSLGQAKRWFDPDARRQSARCTVEDREILENPYRMVETDLGDAEGYPVTLGLVDRGLMPDATVAKAHPVPKPSRIESPHDRRRVRAALDFVLRWGASEGDSLMSESEALAKLAKLELARPCDVTVGWLGGENEEFLSVVIDRLSVKGHGPAGGELPSLQRTEMGAMERKVSKILKKRAAKKIPSLGEDWKELLIDSISESGQEIDLRNPRHELALKEQAKVLERVTTRRLTVLVGRAGTGKTTVLGALTKSGNLSVDGIVFLAPTGKAAVKVSQKTGAKAMTVAQFLYHLKRYDGLRQRVLMDGPDLYRKEKTVVIDESSMLTLDDLAAVLFALDLGHVERVILVGDPNQLPPIGVGRPFADLVAFLDEAIDAHEDIGGALGRLKVEVRTTGEDQSDALRLASWYTQEPQPVDADKVLGGLGIGSAFNDLSICFWETPEDLRLRIEEQFVERLGLNDPMDVESFNRALGLTPEGWVPFDDHDGAERFQILTPVRLHMHGVYEINRWIQERYRAVQLEAGRKPWGLRLGDEEIVWGDKVIMLKNGMRWGWDGKNRKKEKQYLANGEVGVAAQAFGSGKNKYLDMAFANRPNIRFGFPRGAFSEDRTPLELAYALTVHKAQGSEFGIVFVIVPERCFLLSRELLYTALTRSREHVVLLIQGSDASALYELTKKSETARRNTNLFVPGLRPAEDDVVPYAWHLVHRTVRGEVVRSKSELAIANYLAQPDVNLPYLYERALEGSVDPRTLRPDFSFVDDAGDVIIWEHLGMLDREDYRQGWEWKKNWYAKNGYVEGENLFTTSEVGGLDMKAVAEVAARVKAALE